MAPDRKSYVEFYGSAGTNHLKLVLVQLSKDKDTKVEEDNWGATL